MTDATPPDDPMRALAQAAAAGLVQAGATPADLRFLIKQVSHDERAAARLGRCVAATLREWLGEP